MSIWNLSLRPAMLPLLLELEANVGTLIILKFNYIYKNRTHKVYFLSVLLNRMREGVRGFL